MGIEVQASAYRHCCFAIPVMKVDSDVNDSRTMTGICGVVAVPP